MAEALDPAIPGRSHALERGFVTYTDDTKQEILGVPVEVLATDDAVSETGARAMAEGALARSRADVAVAITGFAEGGPGQPADLFHFACARRNRPTLHRELQYGDIGRAAVRLQDLETAQGLMRDQFTGTSAAAA